MHSRLHNLKIKTQIVIITAFILGIIFVLQIFLFSVFQRESIDTTTSIFDSIANNIATQINTLEKEVEDSSLYLASHSITQSLLYEYTPVEIIRNSALIDSLLVDHLNRNKSIALVGFIKGGRLFKTADRTNLYNEANNIANNLPDSKKNATFFPPTFTHNGIVYFSCVTPVFPINVENNSSRFNQDYVIFMYEIDSISMVHSGIIDNNSISLVVTDSSNNILLSTTPVDRKVFDFEELHENHLYKTYPLSNDEWKVTIYMSSWNASNFFKVTLVFVMFIILFTAAMLFVMLKLLNVIIVKRIKILKERVEKISKSDTTYRIKYGYNDEFSVIITSINEMLDKVHNLNREKLITTDNLYKAELLQKETQILYLYGQVSPHFFYNSLVHIQGLALSHNVPQIADMTVSLSKVFRYYSNNRSLSTIGQDLDCAIEYFNIINKRRTDKIRLITEIDPSLNNIPCLKMLYQPILENTLKHAYGIDDSGTVTINSVYDEKMAIIEISDDGCGISQDKLLELDSCLRKTDLKDIQNGDNIGLLNVNMRLKLYYNNADCGLVISSEEGNGTTVRIIFEKEAEKKTTDNLFR